MSDVTVNRDRLTWHMDSDANYATINVSACINTITNNLRKYLLKLGRWEIDRDSIT